MNKIPVPAPKLWISRIREVQSNDTSRFDVIVSVCQDTCWENVSDDVRTRHYALADDEDARRNWGGSTDYEDFARAVNYVLGACEGGHETLVHCHAGQNRSCAVSAAALATYHDEPFEWAENLVRRVRPMNTTDLMESHAKVFIAHHTSHKP